MAKQILPNGIGNIVMYSLSTGINVPIHKVLEEASLYKIPTHLLMNAQSTTGAFRKACTEVASSITRTETPCVRKIIAEDNDILTIVFEKRMEDTEDDIQCAIAGDDYVPTYPPVLRINYNKLSGTVQDCRVYQPCGDEIFRKVMDKYDSMRGSYTIKQMRGTIQSAFDYYGSIKLRHNGGVNFIPHTKIKEWRNFTNFIECFEGVEIMELSVGNTQHNKNTVRSAFESSINETLEEEIERLGGKCEGSKELNELVADLATTLQEYSKGKMTASKKQTLESMLARFKATMNHVKVYQDMINADLSSIDSQVELAKKQVMAIVKKVNA